MDTPQSPAVYALLKLHADLGGRIQKNRQEAAQLRRDMKHVEAVLHLPQPGFSARSIAPRRRNNVNPWFRRGTVFRAALGVLKEAPGPMSAEEIAVALLQSKGVAEPTRDQRRHMYGAVERSLADHRGKTVEADDSRPRRWSMLADLATQGARHD
jgi:hypothetical protein